MKNVLKRMVATVLALSLAVSQPMLTAAFAEESASPQPTAQVVAESTEDDARQALEQAAEAAIGQAIQQENDSEPAADSAPEPAADSTTEPTADSTPQPGEEPAASASGDLSQLVPGQQGSYALTTDENGDPQLTLSMDDAASADSALNYDEAAAAQLNNDSETYLGTVPDTNLAVTQVTPQTGATEMDLSEEEELAQKLKAAVNSEVISAEETQAVLTAADAFSASLNAARQEKPLATDEEQLAVLAAAQATVATPETAEAATPETATPETAPATPAPETETLPAVDASAWANLQICENDYSLVRFLGGNEPAAQSTDENTVPTYNAASVSKDIAVVDENALLVFVKDENGNGIPGAVVTLCWQEPDSAWYNTRTIVTSTAGVGCPQSGVAIFNDMHGSRYGLLDVQAQGYHTVTSLDVCLDGGTMVTRYLTKNKNDNGELYIRCADLDGSDLLNQSNTIALVDRAPELPLTVLLARTNDNVRFPVSGSDCLSLNATNAKLDGNGDIVKDDNGNPVQESRVLYDAPSFAEKNYYVTPGNSGALDGNTMQFRQSACWGQTDTDNFRLLRAGDKLSLSFGGTELPLNATVQNAVVKKSIWLSIGLNLNGSSGKVSATVPKEVPGIGGGKASLDLIDLSFSCGVLPDGTYYMSYGTGTENALKEVMQGGGVSTPHKEEKVKTYMQQLRDKYSKKIDLLRQGRAVFKNGGGVGVMADKAYSLSLDAMGTCYGRYNNNTGRLEGDVNLVVTASGNGNVTFYVIVPMGPVAIPFYGGFSVGITGEGQGGIGMSIKPNDLATGHIFNSLQFSSGSDSRRDFTFTLIAQLAAYAGIGIHGVLNVQLDGGVSVTGSAAFKGLSNVDAPRGQSWPHCRVSAGYSVGFSATALFFRYSKTMLSSSTIWYDSWGWYEDHLSTLEAAPPEEGAAAWKNVDMASVDEAGEQLAEASEETVAAYAAQNGAAALATEPDVSAVSAKALADNQMQYVTTPNDIALFRIASINGKPRLVYQTKEWKTGLLSSKLNVVEVSEGPQDVMEYYIVANQTDKKDERYRDNVYLCVITSDYSGTSSVEERAKNTSVHAITLNLLSGEYRQNTLVSAADGKTYHFNALAAGCQDACTVAWKSHKGYCPKDEFTKCEMSLSGRGPALYMGESKQLLTTGFVAKNMPTFLMLGSEDKYFLYEAANHLGHTALVSEITGGRYRYDPADKNPPISSCLAVDQSLYAVIGGYLYLLQPTVDISYGEKYAGMKGTAITDKKGNPFHLPDNCDMYCITPTNNSALFLVTMRTHYNTDLKNGTSVADGSVISTYLMGANTTFIRDPVEKVINGAEPAQFTAVCNSVKGKGTGISVAYSVTDKIETDESLKNVVRSCQLYQWQQSGETKLDIVNVSLDQMVLQRSNSWLEAEVAVRNIGYNIPLEYRLKITDADGNILEQNQKDGAQNGYYTYKCGGAESGQTMVQTIQFKPNKNWKVGAQSLTFSLSPGDHQPNESIQPFAAQQEAAADIYAADGAATDKFSLVFDSELLNLTGTQVMLGGQHVAQLQISNKSIVPSRDAVILAVPFSGNDILDEEHLLDGTHLIDLSDYNINSIEDATLVGDSWQSNNYCLNLPLETYWSTYADMGITDVMLVLLAFTPQNDGTYKNSISTIDFVNPYAPALTMVSTSANEPLYGTADGDGSFAPGTTVTLTATPAAGYAFTGWQNDAGESVSADPSFGYTAGVKPAHFQANFVEDGSVHLLTLAAEPLTNAAGEKIEAGRAMAEGTGVTVAPTQQNATYYVEHGTEAKLTAIPLEGYQFLGWYEQDGTLLSADAETTLTVNAAKTLTAKFEVKKAAEPLPGMDILVAGALHTEVYVPQALTTNPNLNTVDKIKALIREALAKQKPEAVAAGSYDIYGVPEQVTSAIQGPFTYTLPYPEGTDSSYDFAVVGMLMTGKNVGGIETPSIEKTVEGLRVIFSDAVEFGIAWDKQTGAEPTVTPAPGGATTPAPGGAASVGSGDTTAAGATAQPTAKPRQTGRAPATSDQDPLMIWVLLLMASGGVWIVLAKKRKK